MTKLTQIRQANRAETVRRQTMLWIGFAAILIVLPFILWGLEGLRAAGAIPAPFIYLVPNISTEFALPVLTNIWIAAVFALSYNMLLGQGGMLSFGHAVYYGLGGYFTMHMMNFLAGGYIPMWIMPIFGGMFGLVFGFIFGSFSTRRAGTVFAMISLGIGELVAASSLILIPFFGGEEGIEANRTLGPVILGIDLKQDNQVYYFAAFWFFIATYFMYWFSRTPAGRMANAVRDNPERVEFVGYNMQKVRYVSFIASAFFAGLAGGMLAVKLEIVTETVLNAASSGAVLLQAYIGGALYFIGPIVGAFVVTILNQVVGGFTELSLLYSGLLFIAVVLFVPQGLTGLIVMHGPAIKVKRFWQLIPAYILMIIPVFVAFVGLVGFIETTHFLENAAVGETQMTLFYMEFNADPHISYLPATLSHWLPRIFFALLFFVGIAGAYFCRPVVIAAWQRVEDAVKAQHRSAFAKKESDNSDQVGEKATA